MKLSLTNTLLLGASFLFLAGAFLMYSARPMQAQANSPTASVISVATTSAAVAVLGTGSTQILASSSNPLGIPGTTSFTRIYASICNNSASPVFISINGDKPTATGVGTKIIAAAAGYDSCFEITDRNLTQGAIRASSTVASTNVSVTDYVQ